MKTPIADFVRGYEQKNMIRLHMPGHKGKTFLGCEGYDITEVKGADSLYEASGIIEESENNATKLFHTGRTLYSTEGSSQCIRAMLYLALTNSKCVGKPVVLAARNVHKAFVYASALLDLEVKWMYPEGDMRSLCSCKITAQSLRRALSELKEPPIAVYVTSPDYLGGVLDIQELADICHEFGTILAVDNAHGAYLHFLPERCHPIDLGADICCDSAHKTLSSLTGGAYLHISKNAPAGLSKLAKSAMSLFGSTSPSYLILSSLDLCNKYLTEGYEEKLKECVESLNELKSNLRNLGWNVVLTEPLKLTISLPSEITGEELSQKLREQGVECEYADPEYIVCMFTPEIDKSAYDRVELAFGINPYVNLEREPMQLVKIKQVLSIREAVFSEHEEIAVKESQGRICGNPTVSCPPAIPIVVSGEEISREAIQLFDYYGIEYVDVIK